MEQVSPLYPVTGDVVCIDPSFGTSVRSVPMFDAWGDKVRGDTKVGDLKPHQTALVLQDLHPTGGNGVRILTDDGNTGWVSILVLTKAW